MLYFFILPAVALATFAMSVVSLICRLVTRLRWAYPYAWRVLVWSVVGFVVANIPIVALYLLPLLFVQSGADPKAIGKPVAIVFAAGLFLGPLVALVVGYGGGAVLGLWFGFKATRVRLRNG